MQKEVVAGWYGGRWWLYLLWPLSLLFGLVVACRRFAYRHGGFVANKLPVTTWVVGNITVGGAGKTPLTIALVEAALARGLRVGVISRGYGGKTGFRPQLVTADSNAQEVGDEPLLIARRTGVPVMVHRDRYSAGLELLAVDPMIRLIITDDGLQHYRLQRDCEIAVIDGQRRLGNGLLLPAGPLREPPSRLNSVDVVVCNGGQPRSGEWPMTLQPSGWRNIKGVLRQGRPDHPRLWALAGIANPQRFFATLDSLGVTVEKKLPLADHFALTDSWIEANIPEDVAVVMTEKDAVKLTSQCLRQVWYLEVTAHLPLAMVDELLAKHPLIGADHGP